MKALILFVLSMTTAHASNDPAGGRDSAAQQFSPEGRKPPAAMHDDVFMAPEEELHKFEFGLSTAYAAGMTIASSWRPGVGIFFGYKLSPRSTLGLKFDTRLHGHGGERERYTEIALSYKYWLAFGRKWSPYLQVSAGYVRTSPSEFVAVPGWLQTERAYQSRGDFTLQLGGGYRYSLGKDFGVDLGLHLDNIGAKLERTFLVGTVGLDETF